MLFKIGWTRDSDLKTRRTPGWRLFSNIQKKFPDWSNVSGIADVFHEQKLSLNENSGSTSSCETCFIKSIVAPEREIRKEKL